jgi:hypothetical protein
MKNFSAETAKKILTNEIKVKELLKMYPEFSEDVLKEIEAIKKESPESMAAAVLGKYSADVKLAQKKIAESGFNQKAINAFLPKIIKARFAYYLLEQTSGGGVSSKKPLRLNLWDGMILQRLLFKAGLERKPVSVKQFKLAWNFIINKKILLPLLIDKGIYCFYSKELIVGLSNIIAGRKCHEIAAGDGTLTRFLNESGTECGSSDDYSWENYIAYPDFVEKADAKTALKKYSPQVVICSWPVPKNSYEKFVFQTDSVETYIVIGTRNPNVTCDFELYNSIKDFSMEPDEVLSSYILPQSKENAVFVFRRK